MFNQIKASSPSVRTKSAGGLFRTSTIPIRKKLVIVGDGACGKTSLVMVQAQNTFPTAYVPTVFENYVTEIKAENGKIVQLALWDTAGQEDYDRLRPLSYPDSNIVLICFSIDNPSSLENAKQKWAIEVDHYCPNVPKILIGLKADLRKQQMVSSLMSPRLPNYSSTPKLVSVESAQEVAFEIGAWKYIECSAKLRYGVDEIFDAALNAIFESEKKVIKRNRYRTVKSIINLILCR